MVNSSIFCLAKVNRTGKRQVFHFCTTSKQMLFQIILYINVSHHKVLHKDSQICQKEKQQKYSTSDINFTIDCLWARKLPVVQEVA